MMSVTGDKTLEFSEEQAMLLDVAREFCRDKSPVSRVREFLESDRGYDPNTWEEMVGLGWAGIALPEACGGSSMGISSVVPVVESMGRAMLGTPLISSTLASQLLLRADAGSATEGLLAEIAAGTAAALALMENEDWGNPGLACRLGDDGCINGTKKYVVDGAAAARDFGAKLIAAPRVASGYNSISEAIAFCDDWIRNNGFTAGRKVIDVSGDAGQRGGGHG